MNGWRVTSSAIAWRRTAMATQWRQTADRSKRELQRLRSPMARSPTVTRVARRVVRNEVAVEMCSWDIIKNNREFFFHAVPVMSCPAYLLSADRLPTRSDWGRSRCLKEHSPAVYDREPAEQRQVAVLSVTYKQTPFCHHYYTTNCF